MVLVGLATIAPAFGIRCYVKDCTYYPDEDPYCRGSGVVDCLEADDDKCGTLAVTLGSGTSFTVWNCTRSTHGDCDQTENCDHMRELAVDIDDTVDGCSVTCCDGDGCNMPGKKEEEVVAVVVHIRSSHF